MPKIFTHMRFENMVEKLIIKLNNLPLGLRGLGPLGLGGSRASGPAGSRASGPGGSRASGPGGSRASAGAQKVNSCYQNVWKVKKLYSYKKDDRLLNKFDFGRNATLMATISTNQQCS